MRLQGAAAVVQGKRFGLISMPPLRPNAADAVAKRSQPLIRIVGSQPQPELRPRREHAIRFADAPRHVVGPLWLRLSYNSGLSFSVSTHGASWAALITVAVALGVLALALRARVGAPTAGFGLLLGGGVANVVDRVMASPHVVTDFISVGSFPVFNLADAAVTLGFVVLMICTVRGERLLT